MANQVNVLFGERPQDFEKFIFASQISQAEAVQFLIQHFRSRKGHCTGYMWWNIRDGWPQISDAVVDYYGIKKLAYTYIQRCQQDVCLMMEEREDGVLSLFGVNDTQKEQTVVYSVTDANGKVMIQGTATLPTDRAVLLNTAPADGSQKLWKIDWKTADGAGENSYLTGKPPYSVDEYIRQAGALGLLQPEGFTQDFLHNNG